MKNLKPCLSLLVVISISNIFFCGCNRQESERLENTFRRFFIKRSEILTTRDNTPPSLFWEVTELSSNVTQTVRGPENILTLRRGTKLRVVLISEDLESGIKEMSREESSDFRCMSNGVGVAGSPYYARESAYIPDLGEYAFRRYEMKSDTVFLNFCSSFDSFQSGYYNFRGQVTNYQNIQNRSNLTIQVVTN
jgi:hypothetical protein